MVLMEVILAETSSRAMTIPEYMKLLEERAIASENIRWELSWSPMFDYAETHNVDWLRYDVDLFKQVVKDSGGRNVRTGKGPDGHELVTWTSHVRVLEEVGKSLLKLPQYRLSGWDDGRIQDPRILQRPRKS